jgi:hypothetical protein
MLSLAVKEWELCHENPALGIKLFRETKRERFVTYDELRKIGKWLAEVEREGTELARADGSVRFVPQADIQGLLRASVGRLQSG